MKEIDHKVHYNVWKSSVNYIDAKAKSKLWYKLGNTLRDQQWINSFVSVIIDQIEYNHTIRIMKMIDKGT